MRASSVVTTFIPGLVSSLSARVRREAGIEREAARGAEHRRGGAGEAGAVMLVAERAGARRDLRRGGARIGQQGREQQCVVT